MKQKNRQTENFVNQIKFEKEFQKNKKDKDGSVYEFEIKKIP